MTTSLKFDGPADLSIGQIRISDANGLVREWMATPEQRSISAANFAPGFYVAEIEPVGVSPRSVVFEVQRGQANTITIPDFSYLAANGSGTTFVGVDNQELALKSLFGFAPDEKLKGTLGNLEFTPKRVPENVPARTEGVGTVRLPQVRRLSVGLSMERLQQRESWAAFTGICSADANNDSVALNIVPPADWSPASGRRARLTVAIEGIRIERLLLPLYRGGTTVRVTASPQSVNDVALEVTPSDPTIRALWRAIDSGTRDHAATVRDHVLRVKGPEPIAALEAADPWEAMLAGLLYLRFPEEFGLLGATWAEALCAYHPWAADSYVIRAKQAAAAAAHAPQTAAQNAELAVRMLIKAQSRGSPYFTMTNQYFNELVESLIGFEALGSSARLRIEKASQRWQRELPLQRCAGTSFSWVSRDQEMLKKGILAPKRKVSGRLRSSDTAIAFKGLIKSGAISFESPTATAPKQTSITSEGCIPPPLAPARSPGAAKSPDGCPALARTPKFSDDPNRGRFGRKACVGGFNLSARFPEKSSRFVAVQLSVTAAPSAEMAAGDSVWFCLHPTFNPEWVRVFFRGRTASLTVRAWGGFTVGAWLPSQRIELEYNLATDQGAPHIIRTR